MNATLRQKKNHVQEFDNRNLRDEGMILIYSKRATVKSSSKIYVPNGQH